MEIDWKLVKMTNGAHFKERFVDTPTGRGESFVSKGRKMVIVLRHIKTARIEKKIRGYMTPCNKSFYDADIYTDFGKVVTCQIDRTVTNEHYVMGDGSVFTSKWQVYLDL